jgi:hypothetical protein
MESDPGRAGTNRTRGTGASSKMETLVSQQEGMTPPTNDRRNPLRKTAATAAMVGALFVGGIAGTTFLAPQAANAQSATTAPSAAPATTQPGTATDGTASDGTTPCGRGNGAGNHGFGRNETVSDLSVVAKAIGITEADLQTALDGGQTVAAVAKAHNVDDQVVIDALVADGQSELAADVSSGKLTQAQADAQKDAVTQRATDQVNGTMSGGPGGGHGSGDNGAGNGGTQG